MNILDVIPICPAKSFVLALTRKVGKMLRLEAEIGLCHHHVTAKSLK